jgi:hypothetical protein
MAPHSLLSKWKILRGFSTSIPCSLIVFPKALFFYYVLMGWDWVHLVPRPLFGLLYQPQMLEDECGAIGGMRIDRGNPSTWRKPAPVTLCPPQIKHDLTRARTRAAGVGSRRLTAWAMARPFPMVTILTDHHRLSKCHCPNNASRPVSTSQFLVM